jgi:hypothetical protein
VEPWQRNAGSWGRRRNRGNETQVHENDAGTVATKRSNALKSG